jgi:predicted RNA-binding Zn-ribbon protein involved in translation (DUF1610 family)
MPRNAKRPQAETHALAKRTPPKCRQCKTEMRLDEAYTKQYDFWYCPKCGYWDCTGHQ